MEEAPQKRYRFDPSSTAISTNSSSFSQPTTEEVHCTKSSPPSHPTASSKQVLIEVSEFLDSCFDGVKSNVLDILSHHPRIVLTFVTARRYVAIKTQ